MNRRTQWTAGLVAVLALKASCSAAVMPVVASLGIDAREPSTRILSRSDLEAWLDGYLPYALEHGDVAGAVVVVVKDGQVVLQKGYGHADAATKRPVDPETTLFRPGSVSKLFTWTAVMQQVEQGTIDLDRDINAYLDFNIPAFQGRAITMRNLMTHTAGFQYALEDVVSTDAKKELTLAQYVSRRLPVRIFPPGEVPSYSNYGVALAGYIVQRVSGQPFDAYIERHLFAPLEMQHATFRQPLPAELKPQMSSGYGRASGLPQPYEIFPGSPSGGAVVSGADMGKFMIAHLQDGEYHGQRILRQETARLMHSTPHTVVNAALNRMLLGFFEVDHQRRIIGHEGDSIWFHSVLQLFLDEHVGLFVSLNSVGRDGAARAIRAGLIKGFAERYFPAPPVQPLPVLPTAKADAGMMVGHYEGSQGEPSGFLSLVGLATQVTVKADPIGRLSVSSIEGPYGQPLQFEEIGPFLWREIGGTRQLAARVVGGKVVMWAEDGNSADEAYTPTPWWRNATWLVPMLVGSLAVLLLTVLTWPVGALMRRVYGVKFLPRGTAAHALRWARIGAVSATLLLTAWLVTIGVMIFTFAISSALEPWILILHLASLVVFPGAAVGAMLNLWMTYAGRNAFAGAFTWIWYALLAVSGLTVLWAALVFHLIGLGLHF